VAAKSVTHTGDKQAAASVHAVGERGGDLRGAAAKVRTIVRQAQEQRFDSAGFGRWPALKQSTIENKARTNSDRRPLRKTGALYRSLTAARARGQVDDRKRDSLAFGTNLPYARFHQQGKGVPQRELESFPTRIDRELTRAMDEYVTTGR